MTIADLDHLTPVQKKSLLQKCCGSSTWISNMLEIFPVNDLIDLLEYADDAWQKCNEKDWLEAIIEDPLSDDTELLSERYASGEHSGVNIVSQQVQQSLVQSGKLYSEKFGFPFIAFASQKSEGEMLSAILERLNKSKDEEIKVAAAEQLQIIKMRLRKLFA